MSTIDTQQVDNPNKFKADFLAGLVVFLVALPLCLGIAVASGVPPAAGLLAGIIGGLVIGPLSGSSTSVSGPAAGLVAIVLAQVDALEGFDKFIVAVFLAGIMQLAMGLMKAGSLSAFFPASVIRGLLAAIGVILILKQIPYFFCTDPDASFFEKKAEMAQGFFDSGLFQPGAMLISILCILVLIYWKRIDFLNKSSFPAALAVVVLGIVIQFGFQQGGLGEKWEIKPEHKVEVPVLNTMSDLLGDWQTTTDASPNDTATSGIDAAVATEGTTDSDTSEDSAAATPEKDGNASAESKSWLTKPDFSVLSNWRVYIAALTIVIVASLETLLNLEAVDKLDPKKRPSPANRELLAQGAGNCVAGLVGALPVTSVIIRSSVNIHSGVETKRSAIIHGIFLVCAVIIFAGLMNQIPLACLAAILIMTGFKLASPKLFISLWKQGYQQFVPFIVTLLAIVFTDLLVGVIVGLVVALICIPIFNFKNAIQLKQDESNEDDVIRVELSEKVSFLSRLSIKKTFDTFQPNSTIVIDGSKNLFIDPDTLEMIDDYAKRVGPDNQVNVSIEGLDMSPLEMASGGH